MSDSNRVKIDLKQGIFEIEGNEEFISNYSEVIDQLLTKIKSDKNFTNSSSIDETNGEVEEPQSNNNGRDNESTTFFESDLFGEVYNKVPNKDGLGNKEKILIGAYYNQVNSDDRTFRTTDVTDDLELQGVKIKYPSTYITRLKDDDLIFNVEGQSYRVSDKGEKEIFEVILS